MAQDRKRNVPYLPQGSWAVAAPCLVTCATIRKRDVNTGPEWTPLPLPGCETRVASVPKPETGVSGHSLLLRLTLSIPAGWVSARSARDEPLESIPPTEFCVKAAASGLAVRCERFFPLVMTPSPVYIDYLAEVTAVPDNGVFKAAASFRAPNNMLVSHVGGICDADIQLIVYACWGRRERRH